MRTYLGVPFSEKDAAKRLGAQWDMGKRSWYVPAGHDLAAFNRWRLAPGEQGKRAEAAPPPKVVLPGHGRGKASLYVDMVPRTAWYTNLRSLLTRPEWDICKRACYQRANYCCEACSGKGSNHPVEAHERWAYDEQAGIQRLTDVVAFCPDCHEATHFGLAEVRGRDHLARQALWRVNGWTRLQTETHLRQAKEVWTARSQREWTLDATWVIQAMGQALSQGTRQAIQAMAEGRRPERVAEPEEPGMRM